jgi:Pyruvate/2-oxoacid:ferredoxin oxidoreductase gamma subunit
VNTAILGSFIKLIKLVGLEALLHAVEVEVPVKKEANVAAAKEAYHSVKVHEG